MTHAHRIVNRSSWISVLSESVAMKQSSVGFLPQYSTKIVLTTPVRTERMNNATVTILQFVSLSQEGQSNRVESVNKMVKMAENILRKERASDAEELFIPIMIMTMSSSMERAMRMMSLELECSVLNIKQFQCYYRTAQSIQSGQQMNRTVARECQSHESVEETAAMNEQKGSESGIVKTIRQSRKISRKYGNLIVLFRYKSCLISIGPDYLCFLPALTMVFIISYLLCRSVSNNFANQTIIFFTYALCITHFALYLSLGLSNPSLILQDDNPICEQVQTDKNCQKCGVEIRRRSYHCRRCDVCVEEYDHHCPWVSKCIGKGNLTLFNVFMAVTTFYILISIILAMTCLVVAQANNIKTSHN